MDTIFKCPIRRHDHQLEVVKNVTQRGTGRTAVLYQCPTGRYRWFVVEGHEPNNWNRFDRPRWGWRS